ncbi:MAG: alpha/beta hydrolase [Myxococcales bacterium]|nr:alpha/beta hydrolase [Myxococcales bacterium]
MNSGHPFDHPLVSARYFFPRRDDCPCDLVVDRGDAALACRRRIVDPARRTVVFFHGNGEVVGDYVPDFEDMLLELGVNVVLAEYRGYGRSTGTPRMAAMLDDVVALAEALRLPPARVIAYGRSVGSIYALEWAARVGAAGLVLESGIADPLERVLLRAAPHELGVTPAELRAAAAERFDHRAKLARHRGATLILHARRDHLVDVSHAERLHAWASAPRRLELFARGDHNSVMAVNASAYRAALERFFSSLSS